MGEFMIGVLNTSAVMGLGIAVAGILLKAGRKSYSAACRKKIWVFLAFCLLVPFSLLRIPRAYTAEIPDLVLLEAGGWKGNGAASRGTVGGIMQPVQNQAAQDTALQNQLPQSPSSDASGQGYAGTEFTVADVAFIVWVCVGVLLAAYYTVGYWRMRGRLRRWGSECRDGHVGEALEEAAAWCGLKRIPQMRIMQGSTEGPFTTGLLKNVVILPGDALNENDLGFILKHEAVHCRNHDIAWKVFFLAVNVIHWFNPLVWYLRKAMEQDMEIACDEEVVARASRESRKEYGDVIMSWVERGSSRGSTVSTGYVKGVGFLKRRFDSIFNGGKKKNGILLAGGVCVFVLYIGCILQLQGDRVYAKKKIAIDYGHEVRTDVNGDGETDRVYVSDNNLAGWDSNGDDLIETILSVRLGNGGESTWISYPERWDSYVVTGDLSGNGAADIVLVKIAWMSNHGTGDLTVLHVEMGEEGKPELVEYPSNFIQNPDLELKWEAWEDFTGNYERVDIEQPSGFGSNYLGGDCLGAAIIERDGKTMLRVILLAELQTDSVKCVDCTYTAEGWYIEDMLMYGDVDWGESLLERNLAEGQEKEQDKKQLVINIEDYYSTNLGDPDNLYHIDDNHILWGCGRNDYGQLGQGTQDYGFYKDFVKIAEDVVHVDYCQKGFAIYLTEDGRLYGVGCAGTGALQDYSEISDTMYLNRGLYVVNRPKLLMENVLYARCGHDDVVCLLEDGSVWTWGTVWREGGKKHFIEKPEKILEDAVMVTGGWYNHAALLADGSVWTWGYNYAGNCGVEGSMVVSYPVKVAEGAAMVWTGRTEYNTDCADIAEFGGEYERALENTILLKEDGSYWACGIGIGTEEKQLARYWEANYYTVSCSDEFMQIGRKGVTDGERL